MGSKANLEYSEVAANIGTPGSLHLLHETKNIIIMIITTTIIITTTTIVMVINRNNHNNDSNNNNENAFQVMMS